MPHPERLAELIEYVLLVAAKADTRWARALSETHLLKYAYLADWAHARKHGETYTGYPWKLYHFGPWSQAAQASIEPTMTALCVEIAEGVTGEGHSWVRYHLGEDDPRLRGLRDALPEEVSRAIRIHVPKFGPRTKELLHFVYSTEPMLSATPRELLDLTLGPPLRETAPPLPATRSPSVKQAKRRAERLKDARTQIAESFAKKLAAKATAEPIAPPRYDEVFYDGQAWLDEIAGPPIEEGEGELIIDDSIWGEPRGGEIP